MWVVYKHTSPSGKIYIGITGRENVNLRWCNGTAYGYNKYFTRAIKKYGWKNFTHEIIKDNLTEEEAYEWEIKFIAKYKSNNPNFGYNLSSGGEHGRVGTHHTISAKQKISQANHKRVISEETRKRMSESKKGKPSPRKGCHLSEEQKQKISVANKGRKHTDEAKQKISQASKHQTRKTGYHLSDEHREHISNGLKGKKKTKEHIEKVRLANTGRKFTDEHKRKLSESHKKIAK